jgi:hypothetical protein
MATRSVRSACDRGSLATSVKISYRMGDQKLLLRAPPCFGRHVKLSSHNSSRRPSADWWVLLTANAAGTNGLLCLLKHEGTRDNKVLVTHPMTDQRLLNYHDRTVKRML